MKFVFMVLVIALMGPFASDSYLPSLPQMTEYFGSTETLMQFSVTVYFLGFSLPQLFWGPLSDKMGRRHTLQLGYCLALVGFVVSGFATSAWMLIAGRFIQGAGIAANGALFRPILRDRFSGRRLAQVGSYVGLFFAMVPSIAPIVGGAIQSAFFWQANFIFLFVLTVLVLLFVTYIFPETNASLNPKALHREHFIKNYKTLITNKSFMGYMIASSAAFSGIIAYYTVSPFLFQNLLGLTPFQYGLTAIAITAGLMIGHLINSVLVTKLGIHKIMMASFAVMFCSGVSLMTLEMMGIFTITSVLVPTIFFIMGSGLTFANATAGAFQPFGHMAGAAGAMFGSLQVLGTTIVSFLVALQHDTNGMILAVTFMLLGIVGWLGYTLLVTPEEN